MVKTGLVAGGWRETPWKRPSEVLQVWHLRDPGLRLSPSTPRTLS